MTNEEVLSHYKKMVEIFGDKVPHPDHQPLVFAYYVKLYKTYYSNTSQTN